MLAPDPARWRAPSHARKARATVRKIAPATGDRVLQIGASTSVIVREALWRGAACVVVLDPSPVAIAGLGASCAVSAAQAEERLELVCGEPSPLPWPDGSFSAVAIADLREVGAFRTFPLDEITRVLAPGGRFAGCAGHTVFSFTRSD